MKGALLSTFLDLLMVAFLVAGLVYGIEGARNAGMFMVWVCVWLTPLAFLVAIAYTSGKLDKPAQISPAWSYARGVVIDIAVVLLLAWFGEGAVAGWYVVHMLVGSWLRTSLAEHNAKLEAAKA